MAFNWSVFLHPTNFPNRAPCELSPLSEAETIFARRMVCQQGRVEKSNGVEMVPDSGHTVLQKWNGKLLPCHQKCINQNGDYVEK